MHDQPKKLTSTTWLDWLIGPLVIDFIAPFPLETSLKLLKDEEDTRWYMPRTITINLIAEDADTFGFIYKMWGKGFPQVKADGTLKRWKSDSTLVSAQINLATISYLWQSLLAGFIMLVMLSVFIQNTILLVLLVAVSIVLGFYHTRRQRHDVADFIEEALCTNQPPIEASE